MNTDAHWHYGRTLAAGQLAEFKVWGELIRQSLGGLHVFLPLRDLGLDGVVHRLSDGAYIPVQVKARTELTPAGQVHITVTASSLMDGSALVVAVLVDGPRRFWQHPRVLATTRCLRAGPPRSPLVQARAG